jgi:hypothetical protein
METPLQVAMIYDTSLIPVARNFVLLRYNGPKVGKMGIRYLDPTQAKYLWSGRNFPEHTVRGDFGAAARFV